MSSGANLRESGFERDSARWDNTEGWLSELAELAADVADEPWQGGIRRSYVLKAPIERVWAAFAEPDQLAAWWSNGEQGEIRTGAEGSWDWPSEGGRFAYRIEAVEPPRYLCWTWVATPNVSLADAEQVLRTEWVIVPRDDGGAGLHLFESGFTETSNRPGPSGCSSLATTAAPT